LAQLESSAIGIATNTAKPQAVRDEACGMINTIKMLLGLQQELEDLFKL
jgi:hypothetical protein